MSGVFDFDWQRTYCLLLFLLAEEETTLFDSRLIYERVAKESKRTYAEWIDFAAATSREFEQWGLGLPDMRFSPTGEEFIMLTKDQAPYFLVYSQTSKEVTFAGLDFYLFRFRKNHPYPEQDLLAEIWGRFIMMDFLWLRNRIQEQGIEGKGASSTEKGTTRDSEKKLELAFGKHLEEKGMA